MHVVQQLRDWCSALPRHAFVDDAVHLLYCGDRERPFRSEFDSNREVPEKRCNRSTRYRTETATEARHRQGRQAASSFKRDFRSFSYYLAVRLCDGFRNKLSRFARPVHSLGCQQFHVGLGLLRVCSIMSCHRFRRLCLVGREDQSLAPACQLQ